MSKATTFFAGWLVHPEDRAALLARFPPRYAQAVAHHVTLKFGDREAGPPREVRAEIVGRADDGHGVEALVVRIDGTTDRPDGSTYHITWSLASGREARESNQLIARRGWTWLAQPVPVRLQPRPFGEG